MITLDESVATGVRTISKKQLALEAVKINHAFRFQDEIESGEERILDDSDLNILSFTTPADGGFIAVVDVQTQDDGLLYRVIHRLSTPDDFEEDEIEPEEDEGGEILEDDESFDDGISVDDEFDPEDEFDETRPEWLTLVETYLAVSVESYSFDGITLTN